MTKQIDVVTLRDWLDAGRPVTVVDVRSDADRAQWSIPGSVHVNAYDALRGGSSGPLRDMVFPTDRPIVTVCNAGRMSQAAADVLEARGFDARSLTGGMKAWSLAWNAADVPLPESAVVLIQLRRTGKGCLSYIFGSGSDAAVIDPSLPADVYVDLAKTRGWRIQYVIETHVHADHLSRARLLAEGVGAQLLLPPQRRVHFGFTPFADGQSIRVGDVTLTALGTPGHTDESIAIRLDDLVVFTGDTLFTNGVGRPDLHADAAHARTRAAALFASLVRLRTLPSAMLILPAHAGDPVPFDGRPVAARLADVESWLADWLASPSAFVDRVTSQLPPTPPNFVQIIELNERGEGAPGDPTELEAGANRCAVR
jgi:glyoxylase-like metal-dependent hydrolase (beta-lactamase superfamily II)